MTSNTTFSVNNNIGFQQDNSVYTNNGSSNNDIIVLRDILTGL